MMKRVLFWVCLGAALASFVMAASGCESSSGSGTQSAADYSNPANWMDVPSKVSHRVDTFYLYPTAVTNPDKPLIVAIDDPDLHKGAQAIYERHKPIFSESTDVYAPYYRQINLGTVSLEEAKDLDSLLKRGPSTDAYAALDYYFKHYNNGRPFILAGHSQGSAILRLALREYFKEHPEDLDRMVAAYIVGNSITANDLNDCPYLKFATSSDDTGVVVSWNTEGPENVNTNATNVVVQKGGISINPLLWTLEETYASSDINPGSAVSWDVETGKYKITDHPTEEPLIPNLADARVNKARGVVVCSSDVLPFVSESNAAVEIYFVGPESYHGGDYAFYFDSVRKNVKTRVEAYLDAHQ